MGDVLACHAVEELFQTLCDCAALNPDPQDAGAAFHCQPHHTYALVQLCCCLPSCLFALKLARAAWCPAFQTLSFIGVPSHRRLLSFNSGHAEAEEDADFYYNEEEVRAGAQGEERTAMLDHFDSLLQAPHSADTEEVR